MKVNIEIDCTPEEARAFMGLPDVSEANSIYVDNLANAMKGVTNPDQLQQFAMQKLNLRCRRTWVVDG